MRAGRRRAGGPPAALAGLAVVLGSAALAACAPRTPPDVDPPRPGAPPEEVVAALVEAVNARDAAVLPELAAADVARALEESWFGVRVVEAEIDTARPVSAADAADGAAPGSSVYVHVDLVLAGTDGSFPEGEEVGWGYTLVRQPDGRWLVTEQGVG